MTKHNLHRNMKKFNASQNGDWKYIFTAVIFISLACHKCLIDDYQIEILRRTIQQYQNVTTIVIFLIKRKYIQNLTFICHLNLTKVLVFDVQSFYFSILKVIFRFNVHHKKNDNIIAYFLLSFKEHVLIGIVPRGLNQCLYRRYVIEILKFY